MVIRKKFFNFPFNSYFFEMVANEMKPDLAIVFSSNFTNDGVVILRPSYISYIWSYSRATWSVFIPLLFLSYI